jgi:phosphatidylglycerophosphate synthase
MPDSSAAPRSLVDRLFDPAYRQNLNPATRQVPLLYALYFLCIPLSKSLVRLGVTPTTITHMSNALAIGAVASLAFAASPWWFPLLWLAALCFDIADGTVARTTGAASAQGSFYDHMSDQAKVAALFLCTGARYDTTEIWLLSYAAGATFLFLSVVNQVYGTRSLRLKLGTPAASAEAPPQTRGALSRFMRSNPRLKALLLGVWASVFLMYGNSMVLVLPLSFGADWAVATLLFFWIVTLYNLAGVLRAATRVNAQLTAARIPWKS